MRYAETPVDSFLKQPIMIWTPDPAKTKVLSIPTGDGSAVDVSGWAGYRLASGNNVVRRHLLTVLTNFRGILAPAANGAVNDSFIYSGRLYRVKAQFSNIQAGDLPGSGNWANYFAAALEYSEVDGGEMPIGVHSTVVQVILVNATPAPFAGTREGM